MTRPTGYQALKVQGPVKDGQPPASQSSLRNLTNTSAALTQERDVEIQKLRITQMKNLRREIKKLEKLETLRLAAGGHRDGHLSQLVRFGHKVRIFRHKISPKHSLGQGLFLTIPKKTKGGKNLSGLLLVQKMQG